jgi:hypothetical protein
MCVSERERYWYEAEELYWWNTWQLCPVSPTVIFKMVKFVEPKPADLACEREIYSHSHKYMK